MDERALQSISLRPGAFFGSCRRKLEPEHDSQIIKVLKKRSIGYIFYNGGNDSANTTKYIAKLAKQESMGIKVIGIPKTIDNDLAECDVSPGFGSAARFIARMIRNMTYDLKSMHGSSTKVLIVEVMGRHAGWLCAAGDVLDNGKHKICLLPEVDLGFFSHPGFVVYTGTLS